MNDTRLDNFLFTNAPFLFIGAFLIFFIGGWIIALW